MALREEEPELTAPAPEAEPQEFMLFMHGDATGPETASWDGYIGDLIARGVLAGGSSFSGAHFMQRQGPACSPSGIVGFIRLRCRDLAQAQELVAGNPSFMAGATIEIRQLVEEP